MDDFTFIVTAVTQKRSERIHCNNELIKNEYNTYRYGFVERRLRVSIYIFHAINIGKFQKLSLSAFRTYIQNMVFKFKHGSVSVSKVARLTQQ